jgi:O-antigen ligase
VTDNITGGKLGQRYRGETGGTIEGTREKDLRVMTSGRTEIIEVEWNVFKDNMLVGVGPANGYEARRAYVGKTVASHTEVTRLISEQGIPGLIIAFLFLFFPFFRISQSRSKSEKYYLIGIFLLAIVTSFHASMRTMLTPLLWGVGCAGFIIPDIKKIKSPISTRIIRKPKRLVNAPA